jgi:hypothetical protein
MAFLQIFHRGYALFLLLKSFICNYPTWLAALLDYIENIALTIILLGSYSSWWPLLAFICATIKFILIIMGIFYVLAAWLVFKANSP